jgi:hypothetical protein
VHRFDEKRQQTFFTFLRFFTRSGTFILIFISSCHGTTSVDCSVFSGIVSSFKTDFINNQKVCLSFGANICTQTTITAVTIEPNVPFTVPASPGALPAYCDLSTYSYSDQQLYTFNATGLLVWCGVNFVNHFFGCSNPDTCDFAPYVGPTTCGSYYCDLFQSNGTIVAFVATGGAGEVGLFNVGSCPEGTISDATSAICSKDVFNSSPDQIYTTDIPLSNFTGGCNGTAFPKYTTFSGLARGYAHGQITICPTARFLDTTNVSISVYSCATGFECGIDPQYTNCGDDYECYYATVFGDFIIQVESDYPSLNWTWSTSDCSAALYQPSPICSYSYSKVLSPNFLYTTDISPSHYATNCELSSTSNPTWTSHFNYNATDYIYICSTRIGQDILVKGYDCSQTLTCNLAIDFAYGGWFSCYTISTDFGDPLDGPVHIEVQSMTNSPVEWIFNIGQVPSFPEVNLTIGTMCNSTFTFEAEQNVSYAFSIPPALGRRGCDFDDFNPAWASYAQISTTDSVVICANVEFEAMLFSCEDSICQEIYLDENYDVCGYGLCLSTYGLNGTFVAYVTTSYPYRGGGWIYSVDGCPDPIMNPIANTFNFTGISISSEVASTSSSTIGSTSTSTIGSTSTSTIGSTSTSTIGSTSTSTVGSTSTSTIGSTSTSTVDSTGATSGAASTTAQSTTGTTTEDSTTTTSSTQGGDGK